MEKVLIIAIVVLGVIVAIVIDSHNYLVNEFNELVKRVNHLESQNAKLEVALKKQEGKMIEDYGYLNSRLNKMTLESINK